MKIIHFADLHLGVDTIGPIDPETGLNGRVLDFLDALDALIEFAEDEDVDLAVFAGDAFHRHSPDPTYLVEFADRISRLAKQCPVVLVVGNHDIASALKASSIDVFGVMGNKNVIVGWDYEVHYITTKAGRIQVATFPWPIRTEFVPEYRKQSISKEEKDKLYFERINDMLETLAQEIYEEYPSILVGHFSVAQAMFGSERDMMIGVDAEVLAEQLIEPWDYVALGHIHYHQDVSRTLLGRDDISGPIPPIVYSGSLERIDFSEENQEKGFVLVEVTKDRQIFYDFVETDARPYITIDIDVSESRNPTRDILKAIGREDIQDAVVRVRVEIGDLAPSRIRMREIYAALDSAYCTKSVGVSRAPVMRSRMPEGTNAAAMTKTELLEFYFQDVGVSKRKMKPLMELALEVMEEVDNE